MTAINPPPHDRNTASPRRPSDQIQTSTFEDRTKADVDKHPIALVVDFETRNVEPCLIPKRSIKSENWDPHFIVGCEFEVAPICIPDVFRPVAHPLDYVP
jgi:hypothetical protein